MPGWASPSSAEASRTRGRRRMVCERGGFVGRLDSSLSVAGGIASRGGAIVPHSATGAAPRYRPRSNAIADPTERAQMRDSSGVSQCANGVGGSSGGAARRAVTSCSTAASFGVDFPRRRSASAVARASAMSWPRRGSNVASWMSTVAASDSRYRSRTSRSSEGTDACVLRSARAACSSASKR